MTLLLLWKHETDITIIADTAFRANQRLGLEVGPKIFPVPVRLHNFNTEAPPRACLDMGFAFAGHTAAGQVTHAIAAIGLLNLASGEVGDGPTVGEVAAYYARCAEHVIREFRRHAASDLYLFEAVVFGWQSDRAVAYNIELHIDHDAMPIGTVTEMDFSRSPMYSIGQGHEVVGEFVRQAGVRGETVSPFDALLHVIGSDSVPSVGGKVQAAHVSSKGVELKSVMRVNEHGLAQGGFMGADNPGLGTVGNYIPMSVSPIILPV